MRFFNILTVYAYIISLFLHLNNVISIYEKGLGIPSMSARFLFILFLFGVLLLLPIVSQKIVVRRSLILLATFYIYWLSKLVLDMPRTVDNLILYTLTDQHGTLLYYLLGFMAAVSIRSLFVNVCQSTGAFNFFTLTFTLYLAICNLILFRHCLLLSGSLATGMLIISNYGNNGLELVRQYQVVGDILLVNLLITSVFTVFLVQLTFLTREFLFQFWVLLLTICYSAIAIMTLYICLVTGANKSTVAVIVVSLLTLATFFITQTSRVKELLQNRLSQLQLKNFFRPSTLLPLVPRISLMLVILILIVLALIYYLDLDIEKTRVFNFGRGGTNSSLEIRNQFLQDYFLLHWTYSPIFGNMYVDGLTSGHGTYVHSFAGYLLTHTGIVGFTVFWFYIFFATKELLHRPCIYEVRSQTAVISNSLKMYLLALTLFFLLFASIATHIGWTVVWFVMGFTFSPISFIPKLKFSKVI
ncbi:MAG: hypothetical protein KGR70_12725 [Cyanobacteria bacterium REEB494]|nr:hypothetical protein [Cyanobacteria bacterium REEB494]